MGWSAEREAGFPYWWEAREAVDLPEDLPERCDLLVVGAGYAGLSAALAAQDCGARVVVVDAAAPGYGASSRNGGMVGAHPRLSWEVLSRTYNSEVADRIFAEAQPSLDWLKDLIKREGIACDYQETGRIQLAWSPAHLQGQETLVAHIRAKSDVAVEMVPRAMLGREIATQRYAGGMLFPDHGALHPVKFHQGLLRAVLKREIPVLADAGVAALEREGHGFVARTARGMIRADKVVLCTNGYTSGAFRWHVARVFPLPSYLIATEPLPADLLATLAPGRRMMVETRARHSYFRLSPDGTRILFGGRASMVHIDLGLAAQRLKQTMCEVWPELEDAQLSHVWKGNTGYSFGHMPNVGEDRGLHHAMGFSGSGTVMAPYLGAKAAYRAVGDARGETGYAGTRLTRHWLHPFRKPHFLSAADAWYRMVVDRQESWRSR